MTPSAAADRYGVADARAFVLMLRAHTAPEAHDGARARELCEATRAETEHGTPPPQFTVAQNALDALVTAAESGPQHGLPILADTLGEAVGRRCAEWSTAELVEARRGSCPSSATTPAPSACSLPQRTGGRATPAPCRAARWPSGPRPPLASALDAGRYAAERARGAALTPRDVQNELAETVRSHPAGQAP
ncbi:hypothetical protein [Streptomyces blattellae]|uniref:hypothetical protein n=1 Tax=Streptomyces blattellae TaxID=2569855 RepID=UPI0012B8C114|nr:hypothetical protein [Streptomyces blattellae]